MKQKKNSMADAQGVEAVMVFENPEFGKVRTSKSKAGEPLFCGKDVCDILGYRRTDNAIRQHVIPFDALKQCVWVVTGKKADSQGAGHDDAGAEPWALCRPNWRTGSVGARETERGCLDHHRIGQKIKFPSNRAENQIISE